MARFPCTLSKLSGEQGKVKNERSTNNKHKQSHPDSNGRTSGIENALGVVGAVRFMQQYDTGYGDYTKEKYAFAEENAEEVYSQLKNY